MSTYVSISVVAEINWIFFDAIFGCSDSTLTKCRHAAVGGCSRVAASGHCHATYKHAPMFCCQCICIAKAVYRAKA